MGDAQAGAQIEHCLCVSFRVSCSPHSYEGQHERPVELVVGKGKGLHDMVLPVDLRPTARGKQDTGIGWDIESKTPCGGFFLIPRTKEVAVDPDHAFHS